MNGTILVATDGSHGAATAMAWAGELAARTAGSVRAVHCAPELAEHGEGDGEAVARALTLWTAPAVRTGVEVQETVLRGDPRAEIPELAAEIRPTVVVIGARGEGGFTGLHLGRVARHLLHHTEVPLAIVPRAGGPLQHGVVVAGVDGSQANSAALGWAAEVTAAIGGRLHGVFAHDPMADSYGHGDVSNWKYRGQAHSEQLFESVVAATGTDLHASFLNRGGNAVDVLADHAEETDAAMIVVGTRGHWAFGGRVLGHVASQLPDHSPCPVVVVPHG